MSFGFFEKLEDRFNTTGSLLCVGLDPHKHWAGTASQARDLCLDVIEDTKDLALCYKINSAFFEVFGPRGVWAMMLVIKEIQHLGIPVILDSKRSDIGSTAEAYAESIFETYEADATTVNPLMGHDSIKPFLDYKDKGTFVLCITSNPGMRDFLDELYPKILDFSQRVDEYDNIGLVVAGTYPEYFKEVRKKFNGWILVPGIGAQGGEVEKITGAIKDKKNPKILVNVSRSLYVGNIRENAKYYVDNLHNLTRGENI